MTGSCPDSATSVHVQACLKHAALLAFRIELPAADLVACPKCVITPLPEEEIWCVNHRCTNRASHRCNHHTASPERWEYHCPRHACDECELLAAQ